MRQMSKKGSAFLSGVEGRIPYVYDDGVYPTRRYTKGEKIRGHLTAGVGHLLSRGPDLFPEAHQWIGKTIPDEVIERWLDKDLDESEKSVNTRVKVPLSQDQFDIMASFNFNIGTAAFAGSTLLRKLNEGRYKDIPAELMKWVKTTQTINGKKVKVDSNGLRKRRALEAAYWTGGTTPVVDTMNVTDNSGTQIAEPTIQKTTPLEYVTGLGTVLTPATAFATSTGFVAVAFGIATLVAVAIVAAIIIKRNFFAG